VPGAKTIIDLGATIEKPPAFSGFGEHPAA
jgi:hypothetical protein